MSAFLIPTLQSIVVKELFDKSGSREFVDLGRQVLFLMH